MPLVFRCLVLAVLSGLPGTAFALSCIMPDIVRSYVEARDSPELYSVVLGTLKTGPAPGRSGRARLDGVALSRDGFDTRFFRRVAWRVECLSVWCGPPPGPGERIYFLRHDGAARLIEIGPCDAPGFDPSDASIDRLLACHRDGSCTDPAFDR